jgi:probable F420-dependent oxidoreductase
MEAEKLGYDSIWAPEVASNDAFAILGAIAFNTTRIRVGTGIVPIFTRSPALLAMAASTIADLTMGRAILGIGVSTPTIVREWHGREYKHPLSAMRDTIAIVRQGFLGTVTDYRGNDANSTGFRLDRPPDVAPPIYVAALGPAMRALAREVGDGVILNFLPASLAEMVVSEFSAHRDGFESVTFVHLAVQDSDGFAEARLRREIASYCQVREYRSWLLSCGLRAVEYGVDVGINEIAKTLDADFVRDVAVVGNATYCRERLNSLERLGITPIVVPVTAYGELEEYRSVMRAVAP